jgi:hypothetical protein
MTPCRWDIEEEAVEGRFSGMGQMGVVLVVDDDDGDVS